MPTGATSLNHKRETVTKRLGIALVGVDQASMRQYFFRAGVSGNGVAKDSELASPL